MICSGGKMIKIWDLERRECIHTMENAKLVHSAEFSKDNTMVVSSHGEGVVKLWKK